MIAESRNIARRDTPNRARLLSLLSVHPPGSYVNVEALARDLDIPVGTASYIARGLKQDGLFPWKAVKGRPGIEILPGVAEKIRGLFAAGCTQTEIGAALGVDRNSVRTALRRLGLERKPPAVPEPAPPPVPVEPCRRTIVITDADLLVIRAGQERRRRLVLSDAHRIRGFHVVRAMEEFGLSRHAAWHLVNVRIALGEVRLTAKLGYPEWLRRQIGVPSNTEVAC